MTQDAREQRYCPVANAGCVAATRGVHLIDCLLTERSPCLFVGPSTLANWVVVSLRPTPGAKSKNTVSDHLFVSLHKVVLS